MSDDGHQFTYVSSGNFTLSPPPFDCPKCGEVRETMIINVGVAALDGRYCTRCWVASWASSVPKVSQRQSDDARS